MDRTERLYKMQALLSSRKAVPIATFLGTLEVSRATFRRDLDYLRDRLGAPIIWDREIGGYRLSQENGAEARTTLPGVWLSDREIFSLLSMLNLLSDLQPSTLVSEQVGPVRKRLEKMIEAGCIDPDELTERVKILPIATRPIDQEIFNKVASALLTRKRLEITHFNKGKNNTTQRQVSPQQLVYYRDTWYLDAFCHSKDDLRTFSLDGITEAAEIDSAAVGLPKDVIKKAFEETYGIFAGQRQKTAKLKFTPFRSRWVSKERWHPNQKSSIDAEGNYLLEIPYSDERELVLDILRQGPDCEVLEPKSLREEIIKRLAETLENYGRISSLGVN